jgi:hypothetical protein
MGNPTFVTQSYLPTLDEFLESLKIIWDNKFLTNNGPFHQELENRLADYLVIVTKITKQVIYLTIFPSLHTAINFKIITKSSEK